MVSRYHVLLIMLFALPVLTYARKKPAPPPPTPAADTAAATPAPTPAPAQVPAPTNGSLWSPGARPLIVTKAPAVGDLLVVNVLQSSSTLTSANHSTSKDTSATATPGTGLLHILPGLSASASRATNGSGNSASNTVITDVITVRIIQILPNGNLVVEGNRSMRLEADTIETTFHGEVRPLDIGSDNTIPSSLIANISLVSKGHGPIAEKQRPGLISRLLSLLW